MLARSLSTPWRLVLVATAYEQANDPDELLTCTTREEVGDTLLGHFIPSSVHAVAMLFTPALFFVLLTAYFLGSAAVGPSGWPRTGAFFALIVLWPAAIMVLLGRSAGLGPTNDLLVLSMFGSLYCALGGPMAMYTCWLLINCRRLPFRLSRFLEWSRAAGLIRVTGAACQFRHREFQEWLTRHPVPARPTPTAHPPTRTTTP
ncbi:hypothetical protein ABWJ92_27475 [Streptomyces sp. NPDC000609]|uniref:hypothetical protein n=1 Tax=Streptomyces sp. NPDC000609 TaxID=3160957 RepID=UPI0033949AEA